MAPLPEEFLQEDWDLTRVQYIVGFTLTDGKIYAIQYLPNTRLIISYKEN